LVKQLDTSLTYAYSLIMNLVHSLQIGCVPLGKLVPNGR
jgi:hypothetical protein